MSRVEQTNALVQLLSRAHYIKAGYGPPSQWFGVTLRTDDLEALTDLCEEMILALDDEEVGRLCAMNGEDPNEVAARVRELVKQAINARR